MQLVNGAVHSHRDHQGLLIAPLSHPVDDAGQSGSAHVSGTRGDALTDQMDDVTVQFRGQDTQRGQDVVNLLTVPTVTKKKISFYFDSISYEWEAVLTRLGPDPPLHLRDQARVEASARLQELGGLSVKQQVFIHQLHQNQPDQLAHVLPTDQLLVAR